MRLEEPGSDMLDRLKQHRTLGTVPHHELEWLVAHGKHRFMTTNDKFVTKGTRVEETDLGLEIVLSGYFSIYVDRGAGPRKVLEWHAGDVSGFLPFSRMTSAPGDSVLDVPVETLSIPREHLDELVRECPNVTARCVHVMLDRARVFNTSDWQDEKMVSLGKLAAGLAHELNNPASAVARSAKMLTSSMEEADRAARALALARLTDEQLTAVDRVRDACMKNAKPVSLSPLERADREDEIASWLESHGADSSAVEALAETAVTMEALEELAQVLNGPELDAALDWVAAGCAVRTLAAENERSGSRISELVGAMKRLTHMDRAPAPEPVDVEQGLLDTVMVLAHKARDKSVSVKVDVAPDLPTVNAIGGELNQVWMNLLDNALDAVEYGGQVSATVKPEGRFVSVRIIDNGAGIPEENKPRIFDAFFTTKAPGQGTGLGLEVARTRVRGNGGDIEFESRPGRTEFCVRLPASGGPPVTNATK